MKESIRVGISETTNGQLRNPWLDEEDRKPSALAYISMYYVYLIKYGLYVNPAVSSKTEIRRMIAILGYETALVEEGSSGCIIAIPWQWRGVAPTTADMSTVLSPGVKEGRGYTQDKGMFYFMRAFCMTGWLHGSLDDFMSAENVVRRFV